WQSRLPSHYREKWRPAAGKLRRAALWARRAPSLRRRDRALTPATTLDRTDMTDIVITEFMDEAVVERLRARYRVHHDPELFAKPDELASLLAGVPALIVRNQTQVRGAVLEAGKDLKVVGRLGVGLDNIDMPTCE